MSRLWALVATTVYCAKFNLCSVCGYNCKRTICELCSVRLCVLHSRLQTHEYFERVMRAGKAELEITALKCL